MEFAIDEKKQLASLIQQAQTALGGGDLETATARFQQAHGLDKDHPDVLHGLGQIAYLRGQYQLALRLITEALRRRQHFPSALNNLGSALMKMKEWEAARDTLEGSLRQRPRDAGTLSNLGAVYLELGDLEKAEKHLRRAVELKPSHATAWNNLGNIFRVREEWATAKAHYSKALGLDPDNREALRNCGNVMTKLGEMDKAAEYFRHALDLEPNSVEALTGLSSCKKFSADDPDLNRFERAGQDAGDWTRGQRVSFFFSWGKALDDAKRYDDAFVCFDNGNAQRAEERLYDSQRFTSFVDELMEIFPRDRIEALRAQGNTDESAVFVIGMPRSGTTLTEQILASHPQVFGAGELSTWKEVLESLMEGTVSEKYNEWWRGITGDALNTAGSRYLAQRPQSRGALKTTDKMPGNFLHLGLIRLALPNARILHCVRNPVDVCLSCFQKDFVEGQNFSYRQDWLGQRFRDYARLMEFWRELFPGEWLDVPYEQVVGDPENWARQIVDFAGLPWDDACIEFHRAKRVVHTASVWQVRQPVYKSAVERWRRYESHLQPLLEALGEYAEWHERFIAEAPPLRR